MGPAGSYVKWMPALLLQQWPGPNDDQPYRRIIYFVIFHAIQRRKFHAFIHKKASTSEGRSPTTGTRSLTGALPLGPTGELPRSRYFTPGRYSEGVTVVELEPQKSTQKFLGLP